MTQTEDINAMAEDFAALRTMLRKIVQKDFRQAWQFKIEVDGQPSDFDLFVKDVTFGPKEVTTEAAEYGGQVVTWPKGMAPVELSMTMRDDENETVAKWFDEWASKVVNPDGTVNLQGEYVRKVRRYHVFMDLRSQELRDTWTMYPVRRGDVVESYENGGHLEFQATFVQFRTNETNGEADSGQSTILQGGLAASH